MSEFYTHLFIWPQKKCLADAKCHFEDFKSYSLGKKNFFFPRVQIRSMEFSMQVLKNTIFIER